MPAFKDLSGQKFHRLSVISRAANRNGRTHFLCACDCGTSVIIMAKHIISGHTQSCGCYFKKQASKHNIRHGLVHTNEYTTLRGMVERCTNRNHKDFLSYGGRGITVCQHWYSNGRYHAKNFLADMGPRPDGYSIDRKEVNGNYTPENCRWATPVEQANNKR